MNLQNLFNRKVLYPTLFFLALFLNHSMGQAMLLPSMIEDNPTASIRFDWSDESLEEHWEQTTNLSNELFILHNIDFPESPDLLPVSPDLSQLIRSRFMTNSVGRSIAFSPLSDPVVQAIAIPNPTALMSEEEEDYELDECPSPHPAKEFIPFKLAVLPKNIGRGLTTLEAAISCLQEEDRNLLLDIIEISKNKYYTTARLNDLHRFTEDILCISLKVAATEGQTGNVSIPPTLSEHFKKISQADILLFLI